MRLTDLNLLFLFLCHGAAGPVAQYPTIPSGATDLLAAGPPAPFAATDSSAGFGTLSSPGDGSPQPLINTPLPSLHLALVSPMSPRSAQMPVLPLRPSTHGTQIHQI